MPHTPEQNRHDFLTEAERRRVKAGRDGRSSLASEVLRNFTKSVIYLETAIKTGKARRLGNAIVGTEVDSKAVQALQGMANKDMLGRALVTGNTTIPTQTDLIIGDGTYLKNAQLKGSYENSGQKIASSTIEDSEVWSSTVVGSRITDNSHIESSTLNGCENIDSKVYSSGLHSSVVSSAMIEHSQGSTGGNPVTGKFSGVNFGAAGGSVFAIPKQ